MNERSFFENTLLIFTIGTGTYSGVGVHRISGRISWKFYYPVSGRIFASYPAGYRIVQLIVHFPQIRPRSLQLQSSLWLGKETPHFILTELSVVTPTDSVVTRKFSLYLSDIVFKAILCTVHMVGSQRRVGEHNMNMYIYTTGNIQYCFVFVQRALSGRIIRPSWPDIRYPAG